MTTTTLTGITITYTTKNPHGRARDLLLEDALLRMEREGKELPGSPKVAG